MLPQMKRFPHPLPALLLSASLAGCSAGPAFHRPDVASPSAFGTAPQPLAPAPAVTAPGWWGDFGSPELNDLVARALAANNDLTAAEARVTEARGQSQIAGAAQYPTLSGVGGATAETGNPTSAGSEHTRRSSVTVAAQAAYELDFWGKNRAAAKSGKALADAAIFDRDTVAITVAATTADTYFQILSLNERIATAEQVARDARRILSLVEAQHEVGTATVLQVEQQRTATLAFEQAVPLLRQQQEQAEHALAILLGLPPRAFVPQARVLAGTHVPDVDAGLPSALLLRRPDVRAAEERLRAAHFDVHVARAALLPSLSLTGDGGIASASLKSFTNPIGFADVAASLLAPIIDGGARRGQLRVSKGRVEELAAAYRQSALVAFGDVENALTARVRITEAEQLAIRNVASARHAAELAEVQNKLGTIDVLTLLDTQRALYQAQDSFLQLRLQRLQAAISLYRALGGGMESRP